MRLRTISSALASALIIALPGSAPCAPDLQAPASWDFGTIRQGEDAAGTVELKNAGDGELVIRRVTSSCGCTVARLDDRKLAPGEKTSLKMRFTSGRRYGKVSKAVFVASNDPDDRRHRIEVRGLIRGYKGESFVVTPERLDAGVLTEGVTVHLMGNLENIGDRTLAVREVAHSRNVACDIGAPLEMGPGEEIPFEFTLTPAEGVIKEYVAFTTDRPERFDRVKRLYLSGYALPHDAGSIRLPASVSADEEGRLEGVTVLNGSRNDIEVSGLEKEPGGSGGLFGRRAPEMISLPHGRSIEVGSPPDVLQKDMLYITIGLPVHKRSEP